MKYVLTVLLSTCSGILLLSCAHQTSSPDDKSTTISKQQCTDNKWQSRHIKMATEGQGKRFSRCMLNYLRLRQREEMSLSVCINAEISARGEVLNLSLESPDSHFDQELKWCIEQELWKFDYSALQLTHRDSYRFALQFVILRP